MLCLSDLYPSGKLLASAHNIFVCAMLLERGEEEGEWRVRKEMGREEEGGEIFILYTLKLLVSRVLECVEVETATCALLCTTVLHYMGSLTGNWLSFLALLF